MKRVTGIGGIFFKAENPGKPVRVVRKTPGDQERVAWSGRDAALARG